MKPINQHRLYTWAAALTISLAALGFVSSYITLLTVALRYQMNWLQAAIFPLLLDAFMVVSHLVFFFLSINRKPTGITRWVMYSSVVLSVAFNFSHGLTAGVNPLGLIAWSLPPLTVLFSVKMIAAMVRAARVTSEQKPAASFTGMSDRITVDGTVPEEFFTLEKDPNNRILYVPDNLTKKEKIVYIKEHQPNLTHQQIADRVHSQRSYVSKVLNNGNHTKR